MATPSRGFPVSDLLQRLKSALANRYTLESVLGASGLATATWPTIPQPDGRWLIETEIWIRSPGSIPHPERAGSLTRRETCRAS
jgi:hypothetical protein